MFVATLSLLGFPYTSGFYSKDLLLELFYVSKSSYSFLGYFFGVFAAFLTSFYSFRLLYLVFFNKPKGFKQNYFLSHLEDKRISFVLIFLFFLTLFFGYFYLYYFKAFIIFSSDAAISFDIVLPFYIKCLPLFSLFFGWFLVHYFYYKDSLFFLNKFFFTLFMIF